MARRKKLTEETASTEEQIAEPMLAPEQEVPAPKEKKKKETKAVVFESTVKAEDKDDSLKGTYKVITDLLNIRKGPDKSFGVLIEIKGGSKVDCDGSYTDTNGTRWLAISYTEGNAVFEGYCMAIYLKK